MQPGFAGPGRPGSHRPRGRPAPVHPPRAYLAASM